MPCWFVVMWWILPQDLLVKVRTLLFIPQVTKCHWCKFGHHKENFIYESKCCRMWFDFWCPFSCCDLLVRKVHLTLKTILYVMFSSTLFLHQLGCDSVKYDCFLNSWLKWMCIRYLNIWVSTASESCTWHFAHKFFLIRQFEACWPFTDI